MNYLAIACLVVVTAYTLITWRVLGELPSSISASWYQYGRKGYKEAFSWCLMSIGVLVLTMPLIYTYSNESGMILMFTGFFLVCIAIAAPYKTHAFLHYLFTWLSIGGGFTVTILEGAYWPLIGSIVVVGLLRVFRVPSFTWFSELTVIYFTLGFLV